MFTTISNIIWKNKQDGDGLPFALIPTLEVGLKLDQDIIEWIERRYNQSIISYHITRHTP